MLYTYMYMYVYIYVYIYIYIYIHTHVILYTHILHAEARGSKDSEGTKGPFGKRPLAPGRDWIVIGRFPVNTWQNVLYVPACFFRSRVFWISSGAGSQRTPLAPPRDSEGGQDRQRTGDGAHRQGRTKRRTRQTGQVSKPIRRETPMIQDIGHNSEQPWVSNRQRWDHVWVPLQFQQPTFQQKTQHINDFSAAHVVIYFASGEIMNVGCWNDC